MSLNRTLRVFSLGIALGGWTTLSSGCAATQATPRGATFSSERLVNEEEKREEILLPAQETTMRAAASDPVPTSVRSRNQYCSIRLGLRCRRAS